MTHTQLANELEKMAADRGLMKLASTEAGAAWMGIPGAAGAGIGSHFGSGWKGKALGALTGGAIGALTGAGAGLAHNKFVVDPAIRRDIDRLTTGQGRLSSEIGKTRSKDMQLATLYGAGKRRIAALHAASQSDKLPSAQRDAAKREMINTLKGMQTMGVVGRQNRAMREAMLVGHGAVSQAKGRLAQRESELF